MAREKISAILWRGAIGGALGAPILLGGTVVLDLFRLGYVPYSGFFQIVALPVFAFLGGIFGTLLAALFWVLAATAGIRFSAIIRAVIGICLLLLVRWFSITLKGDPTPEFATPVTAETVITMLLYAGSFGALPGLMAHPEN